MSRAFVKEDENGNFELPHRPISPHRNFVTEEQSFRIVGEDEADPARGTVSYVSPLARAVLTHSPGETVETTGGEAILLYVR
jgi:hypothetical protein